MNSKSFKNVNKSRGGTVATAGMNLHCKKKNQSVIRNIENQ
ncbi:hypothetical protein [Leptospira mayottensis]|nr:hypothetical protein [Leptospira mayottensis]